MFRISEIIPGVWTLWEGEYCRVLREREVGSRDRGGETREDVMHNGLDLCQETKLMKVLGGRGVTMEHVWLWLSFFF